MNYSLFTYEGAFRFPGVALRSRFYFTPLYHALLSLIPITFHLDSCWEGDALMAAFARDTLVLILPLPWAPNLRLPDPTDLIEEQCREISVRWRERGGEFTRISSTSQTGVRFPKQHEMSWIREWKALNHADIHTHIFPKTETANVFTNQLCILRRNLSHMETKLPSSNWSAEIFTKLFTSADAHTLMGSLRANQCNAPKAICMVSSFHLPILYPQIHPSLSAPLVPLLESGTSIPGTEPQHSPQKNPQPLIHTSSFLQQTKGLKCCCFF